jgi:hypothetical protein
VDGHAARLIVRVDARLERLTDARLEMDAPTVERRPRIAGEALEPPPDARGARRARSSEQRTYVARARPEDRPGSLTDC